MIITICMLWFAMVLHAPIWIYILLGVEFMLQCISFGTKLTKIFDNKGE